MVAVIKANEPFSRIVNFLNDSFGAPLDVLERESSGHYDEAGAVQTHSWALFGFVWHFAEFEIMK